MCVCFLGKHRYHASCRSNLPYYYRLFFSHELFPVPSERTPALLYQQNVQRLLRISLFMYMPFPALFLVQRFRRQRTSSVGLPMIYHLKALCMTLMTWRPKGLKPFCFNNSSSFSSLKVFLQQVFPSCSARVRASRDNRQTLGDNSMCDNQLPTEPINRRPAFKGTMGVDGPASLEARQMTGAKAHSTVET